MTKGAKWGTLEIRSDLQLRDKTILISLLKDESKVYYIQMMAWGVINHTYGFIALPPGNYCAKIMGEIEEKLFTMSPYGHVLIRWGIA
jgi:hypothetical protein